MPSCLKSFLAHSVLPHVDFIGCGTTGRLGRVRRMLRAQDGQTGLRAPARPAPGRPVPILWKPEAPRLVKQVVFCVADPIFPLQTLTFVAQGNSA